MAILEFFATDAALAELEAAVASVSSTGAIEQVGALIALAWQLRQRDTKRALALADEAACRLASAEFSGTAMRREAARLVLIRGEAQWLHGELDAGLTLATQALREFAETGDPIGQADANWLIAMVAGNRGQSVERRERLEAMVAAAGLDPVRTTMGEAQLAIDAAFRDAAAVKRRTDGRFGDLAAVLHPAAECLTEDLRGVLASLSSDYVLAIRHMSKAHALALASGQWRRALIAALNISDKFNNLNEYGAALEWTEQGMDIARRSGWSGMIGLALMQTGETLRRLQRFDAAAELLEEALALMAPTAASRNYALALQYLADVELDRRHFDDALQRFVALEQRAVALGQADLISRALRGQAQALYRLGRAKPALQRADAVVRHTQAIIDDRIAALQMMAEIHHSHPLPTPPQMAAPSASLHYLHQALELAASIKYYTPPGEMLEATAREYARIGDMGQAYEFAMKALAAREKVHNQETANRASALQVSHSAQSARAEAEFQRSLTQAQAERLETLERLGRIGREITGNLAATAIFAALDRHVRALLDVDAFLIYRMSDDARTLKMVFRIEGGHALPLFEIDLAEADSMTARCARERRDIVLHCQPGELPQIPDTVETLSNMFSPLLVGERLLGVMVIATPKPNAYGERETAIFSTLCAYAAIALANAEAQAQLIQSEKLASLGQLVASVAHEINTPIAAVKSSGANIADALDEALVNLPNLFERLDYAARCLFIQMLSHVRDPKPLTTSREERAARREAAELLHAEGIADAASRADLLVQMGAHTALALYLPLLRHAECDLILRTAHSISAVVSSTANINTAVDKVAKIVFALKSFSRVDRAGVMLPASLKEGIETVLTIYHNQIKHGVELVRHYQEIPALPCLADELNQVWTNLIHNALQAMSFSGTLTVTIRAEDGAAVVAIGDTGSGIPEPIRTRIFDPFFTTKPTGEGSGLGLDIVRKIVDKHQGHIGFESEVGIGTTFTVRLPYSVAPVD